MDLEKVEKAQSTELIGLIKEARSLADELASCLKKRALSRGIN